MATVIRFRGEEHRVTREDILAAAQRSTPERLTTYYVEIDGRRFPPKQLVRVATGTRQQFNSANARKSTDETGLHSTSSLSRPVAGASMVSSAVLLEGITTLEAAAWRRNLEVPASVSGKARRAFS